MATNRLIPAILLLSVSFLFGAADPLYTPWTAFIGSNGVTVASNTTTKKVIISGVGSGISTNANQFGASTVLTLKDGVRETNAVLIGTTRLDENGDGTFFYDAGGGDFLIGSNAFHNSFFSLGDEFKISAPSGLNLEPLVPGESGSTVSWGSTNANGLAVTLQSDIVYSNLTLLLPTNGFAGISDPVMIVDPASISGVGGNHTGQLSWASAASFGGALTPWTSDIDANGFALTNASLVASAAGNFGSNNSVTASSFAFGKNIEMTDNNAILFNLVSDGSVPFANGDNTFTVIADLVYVGDNDKTTYNAIYSTGGTLVLQPNDNGFFTQPNFAFYDESGVLRVEIIKAGGADDFNTDVQRGDLVLTDANGIKRVFVSTNQVKVFGPIIATNIPGSGPFVAIDENGNLFRTNSPASTNVDYINNYYSSNVFNNWTIFQSNVVFNSSVTFKSTVNFSSNLFVSQIIATNASFTVNTNLGAGGALTNFTVNLDGDNNLFLDGGTTNVNLRAMNWAAGLAKTVNIVITNRTATVRTVSFDAITNNWLGMGTITGPISLTNGLYLSIKSMGGTNMWYGAQYTALPTQ